MPTVTGQNVPPDLMAQFAAITSPGKINQGENGTVRQKAGIKKPARAKAKNLDLIAIQKIAERAALFHGPDKGTQEYKDFVFTVTQQLLSGIVDYNYFRNLWESDRVTLESAPVSVVDPNPPPYSYRIAENQPSRPTYPDGTPSSLPPGYTGNTTEQVFKDTSLRWLKQTFRSNSINQPNAEADIYLRWQPRITISTSNRASRTMLSLYLSAKMCGQYGSALNQTTPPIMEKTSFYWRYKIPPSLPPYFNLTHDRMIAKALSRIIKKSGTGPQEAYLLNASNTPMMGRAFNNNTQVTTSFTSSPELFEVITCNRRSALLPRFDITTQPISRIAWAPALGLFAAVMKSGAGNRVMTSPNGADWVLRSSAADNEWFGIAWSPELGLFAAVSTKGTGNRVMTSPDGINWTSRVSASDNNWFNIAWSPELGLFAAVANSGTGNRVMTSPDGINWTSRVSASDDYWMSIDWSPALGLFAAVAYNGTGGRIMTSPDGINWTSRTSSTDNFWLDIAWSPELGLFAAVSDYGTTGLVMTSPDGINWTVSPNQPSSQWSAITWAAHLNLFIAVSQSGYYDQAMTSPDGINWTARETPVDNGWFTLAYAPEKKLVVAGAIWGPNNRIMTTENGFAWITTCP